VDWGVEAMSIKIKFSQSDLRRRAASVLNVPVKNILNVCSTGGGKKYYVLFRSELNYEVKTKACELTIWQIVDAMPLEERNVGGNTLHFCPEIVSDLLRLGLDCFPDKETLKLAYKRLSKELHPDMGGDAGEFIAMQSSFNQILNRLADRTASYT
jgi:hypothetical protein